VKALYNDEFFLSIKERRFSGIYHGVLFSVYRAKGYDKEDADLE
jgi:hypothetical protein